MTLIAYYRVSTRRQERSGLGLDAQRAAVEDHARRTGTTLLAAYTEAESGRRRDRPELARALAHARAAGATLVVAKLDRLARDVGLILRLVDSGVRIEFLDLPDISADPIVGRLVLTVMAAIAEFEARRIGQRIREAFARRKAAGKPPLGGDQIRDATRRGVVSAAGGAARDVLALAHRAEVGPLVRGLRAEGRSLRGTADELNRRGVSTFTRRPWTVGNVWRVLAQLD